MSWGDAVPTRGAGCRQRMLRPSAYVTLSAIERVGEASERYHS